MLKPAKMREIDLLVFDAAIESVTEQIIRAGLLHPVRISELEGWAKDLPQPTVAEELSWYQETFRRTSELLKKCAPGQAPAPPSRWVAPDQEKTAAFLEEVENKLTPLFSSRQALEDELKTRRKMLRELRGLSIPGELPLAGRYSFLETALGKIPRENLEILKSKLQPLPRVLLPLGSGERETTILVMALRRDRAALEKALGEVSFTKLKLPEGEKKISPRLVHHLAGEIEELQHKIHRGERELRKRQESFIPRLFLLKWQLHWGRMIKEAQRNFKKTRRTFLISGWVPGEKVAALTEKIRQVTRGDCYIEVHDPEEVEGVRVGRVKVPVAFSNPAFLKPFELLIREYGIPEYKSVDPTPLVAVTFLIMFGAMFGDIGHGLVLALLGGFLRTRARLKKIGTLILYCGFSSIVFGFLYGSFFGVEDLVPALWLRPMRSIMGIMQLAVFFGMGMISAGILLNIINAFRNSRFLEAVFDPAGMVGGLFYWLAAGLLIKSIKFHSPPPLRWIVILLGLPVLLFFLKGPISQLVLKKKKLFPEGIFSYFMESGMDLLETAIGYVANTISFIRVAAFALAHIGLFIAVFSLAETVRQAGGAGAQWVVLVGGNIGIILLEGIVVTVQSVRLEYYEFFSRFFSRHEGVAYRPLEMDDDDNEKLTIQN